MELAGEGRRGILVVGEAPGAEEDQRGKPFIGKSGRRLQREMRSSGVDLFRDCWVTNAVICRPPDNRDPELTELEACLPNLLNVLREVEPSTIICLGRFAIMQVIGQLWGSGIGKATRWLGWQIPSTRWNAWVCSMYHPAFIERSIKQGNSVEGLLWETHLRAACELEGRPHEKDPLYHSRVHVCFEPDHAAEQIARLQRKGIPLAFDYECDRLKPDHPDAMIVSCAVSDGISSVSYPWVGKAIEATRDLLWSGTPMMAWNMKFEQRWTRRAFGKGVRNWLWDGMLASHVLDNQPDITSLKFQALVRLGVESYDTIMAPYLKASSGNSKNRIKNASMHDLLLYGGLDALYTALICKEQMKELGYEH